MTLRIPKVAVGPPVKGSGPFHKLPFKTGMTFSQTAFQNRADRFQNHPPTFPKTDFFQNRALSFFKTGFFKTEQDGLSRPGRLQLPQLVQLPQVRRLPQLPQLPQLSQLPQSPNP